MEYEDYNMLNIGCDPPEKEIKAVGFLLPKMTSIPDCMPDHQEIAKQMRINADIIKKEITDHVDKEIKRFKQEMTNAPI